MTGPVHHERVQKPAQVATGGERDALERLSRLLPAPPPGEVWYGDDAAVLQLPGGAGEHGRGSGEHGFALFAADSIVGGLDADLTLTTLADFGWKAMAVNLSDIAAMGGRPAHAVVSVIGLGPGGLEDLYEGVVQASTRYECPVVGGDLSGGDQLVVSVAVTGSVDGPPVLRSGARPGDTIWVTGALGASAAGLRLLRQGAAHAGGAGPTSAELALVQAHARPRPALAEGVAARLAGATAMIDVSDGFAADLGHIADMSGVGFALDWVPVATGATVDEALGGGDDYVLVFAVPPGVDVARIFRAEGLDAPIEVGGCLPSPGQRLLAGRTLSVAGWEHSL